MSLLERSKTVASRAGSLARKQAQRAQLEVQRKRLQLRIDKEYAAIGRAIHPSLASGGPGSDNPTVKAALEKVRSLAGELEEKVSALKNLATEVIDRDDDAASTESEDGERSGEATHRDGSA